MAHPYSITHIAASSTNDHDRRISLVSQLPLIEQPRQPIRNVAILPVSGGGFPTQLAGISHLCNIKYKPDIMLASSGGNVAAYVAAGANWRWPAIERIAENMSNTLFVEPWNSNSALAISEGYFRGNMFKPGRGVDRFLESTFATPESILDYEIWTGTYVRQRQQARLFCNLAQQDSRLDYTLVDRASTNSMPPVYMGGDIKLIAQVAVASASIPTVVAPQNIMGEYYSDGGLCGSSPLSIVKAALPSRCHFTYINPIDLTSGAPPVTGSYNMMENGRDAARDLIRSQTLLDRLTAIDLVRLVADEEHPLREYHSTCSFDNLRMLDQLRADSLASILEIKPTGPDEDARNINIVSFSGADVVNAIRKVYPECTCHLWYVPRTNSEVAEQTSPSY